MGFKNIIFMKGFSIGGDCFDFHDKKANEKYGNALPFSKFIPCDFPSGFNKIICLLLMIYFFLTARVAELVDAHGSGPCVLTDVLVRLQSRAQICIILMYYVQLMVSIVTLVIVKTLIHNSMNIIQKM